jgi:hypothetical protein
MNLCLLGAHHTPAALGFHAAHRSQPLWHAVAESVTVWHLIKTIGSSDRSNANRFKENIKRAGHVGILFVARIPFDDSARQMTLLLGFISAVLE